MSGLLKRQNITPQLATGRLVAIVRASEGRHVVRASQVVAEAGVTCIELTLTTPGIRDSLQSLARELPSHVALGVGTVTTGDQVRYAVDAGAQFIVSPGVSVPVIEAALDLGVPCYLGAMSPTEVLRAWTLGATAVKIFPAAALGPDYPRDLRAPFPSIPLIPTGGIALDAVTGYLAAGCIAVGVGGPLMGDSLEGGSLERLRSRATRLVRICSDDGS